MPACFKEPLIECGDSRIAVSLERGYVKTNGSAFRAGEYGIELIDRNRGFGHVRVPIDAVPSLIEALKEVAIEAARRNAAESQPRQ